MNASILDWLWLGFLVAMLIGFSVSHYLDVKRGRK